MSTAPGSTPTVVDRPREAALARVVREVLAPLIEADGGRIELVGQHGDVVDVALTGACRGCPGQPMTLRGVVLPALQSVAPEVRDIRVVPPRQSP